MTNKKSIPVEQRVVMGLENKESLNTIYKLIQVHLNSRRAILDSKRLSIHIRYARNSDETNEIIANCTPSEHEFLNGMAWGILLVIDPTFQR